MNLDLAVLEAFRALTGIAPDGPSTAQAWPCGASGVMSPIAG